MRSFVRFDRYTFNSEISWILLLEAPPTKETTQRFVNQVTGRFSHLSVASSVSYLKFTLPLPLEPSYKYVMGDPSTNAAVAMAMATIMKHNMSVYAERIRRERTSTFLEETT